VGQQEPAHNPCAFLSAEALLALEAGVVAVKDEDKLAVKQPVELRGRQAYFAADGLEGVFPRNRLALALTPAAFASASGGYSPGSSP
jgi:hypothetical protein